MNARVELITQSAYARLRGVAKSAVAKAVAEGRISLIEGKIDPTVADIQWDKNTRARADSKRTGATTGGGAGDAPASTSNAASDTDTAAAAPQAPGYNDYRTIREKADAEMAQRNNLKAAGLVVERPGIVRGIHDVVHATRDACMAVGQRAAPKCVGLADAREIENIITTEFRKALEGFEARLLEKLPPLESI